MSKLPFLAVETITAEMSPTSYKESVEITFRAEGDVETSITLGGTSAQDFTSRLNAFVDQQLSKYFTAPGQRRDA